MIEINEKVLETVNRTFVIPPRPEILGQLKQIMESDDPSLIDISDVLSKDIALSAAILKLINSPAFGLSRTVSDIRQAVMFLGFDGVYSLVQGLKLKQAFSSEKCSISMEKFWSVAEDIAQVAMYIGGKIKSSVPVENLYTLGLFHDCGMPVLATKYKDYLSTLERAQNSVSHTQCDIEQARYQTDHAVIGYYISSSWYLPKDICQLILRHHERSFLENFDESVEQLSFAVLKMAENIVQYERFQMETTDWPCVKESVYFALDINDDYYVDIKEDVAEVLY